MTSPYLAVEALVVRLVETAATLDEALGAAVSALAASAPHYRWVGIYLLEVDTLVLHNQSGQPTPDTRIPVGEATRFEIVVPITGADGRVVGAIAVDSADAAAVGPEDRACVETAAGALGARFTGSAG